IDDNCEIENTKIHYTLHFDECDGGWHFHHFRLPHECVNVKCLEIMEEQIFACSLHEIDVGALERLAMTYAMPALKASAELIRQEQRRRPWPDEA
ncbi:MAG: hypothetical protein ACYTGH_16135, partial [Planctomycetota bacterium]